MSVTREAHLRAELADLAEEIEGEARKNSDIADLIPVPVTDHNDRWLQGYHRGLAASRSYLAGVLRYILSQHDPARIPEVMP